MDQDIIVYHLRKAGFQVTQTGAEAWSIESSDGELQAEITDQEALVVFWELLSQQQFGESSR